MFALEKEFKQAWKSNKRRYRKLYREAYMGSIRESTEFYLKTGKRLRERKKPILSRLRQLVLTRHGSVCQLCHERLPVGTNGKVSFEAHHIYPEVLGGRTSVDNLVPLCIRCNRTLYLERPPYQP